MSAIARRLMAKARKPFMSAAPRATYDPSRRMRVNGSDFQPSDSAGTVSMWPERIRPWLPSSGPAATIRLSLAPAAVEVVADEVGELAVALVAGGVEGDEAGEKGLVGERLDGHATKVPRTKT